jgi:SSS family solute:Na+ symporter
MLQTADYIIILSYFVVTIGVGVYVTKRASGSIDEYFLGGQHFPWWILGLVGMATYVDMSGTMFQVSYFYMLGVKGYWVAFEGSLALFLAFLMIFMAKWLNRTQCMTNAELMELRFGSERPGQLARLLSAVSILVLVTCFLAYFFVGTAKFLPVYVPIPGFSPNMIALLFFLTVGTYTISAGFHGVVFTDILQAILIFAIVVFISIKAFLIGTPEYFAQYTKPEWLQLMPDSWHIHMPAGYEHMQALGILIIAWLVMNISQGFALPIDAWTSQKFYSAKDPREASLTAGWWAFLFSFRFPLMMGFGVLAVGVASKIAEPELALPVVIMELVPVGIKGLLIAAVIAAAMSTLSGFMNSSAAYFVKDIYQRHLRPDADSRHLVKVSYLATGSILAIGVLVGWQARTIDSIWGWIIMGLLTGVLPPNIAKWFWWRFNGFGFALGMVFGLIGAILVGILLPVAPPYITFCIVMAVSTAGTLLGAAMGQPTDMPTLLEFYRRVRPFGFWGPVRKLCEPTEVHSIHAENRRDLLLLLPACLWQLFLFWFMTAVVVKKWDSVLFSLVVLVALSAVLYKYWYKGLDRFRNRIPKGEAAKTPC